LDPAEEIVHLWLQQQGFFTMHGIKVGYGGKEIDFLGINLTNNKRVHVEVHAAVFPIGPLRPWGPARYGKMPLSERVRLYYYTRFVGAVKKSTGELINRCVEETASRLLGTKNYERWLVLLHLHPLDPEEQLRSEFSKHGVKVFSLKDVLKNIRIEGAAKDQTGRFLQLLAATLTSEAKESLLGRK
jgi:hypothetical protein